MKETEEQKWDRINAKTQLNIDISTSYNNAHTYVLQTAKKIDNHLDFLEAVEDVYISNLQHIKKLRVASHLSNEHVDSMPPIEKYVPQVTEVKEEDFI